MTEFLAVPPHALLVDDNPMVLRALAMLFGSLGWNNHQAEDAEQALAQIKSKAYDLIIIDLKMPDIDGIELCRQIRDLNKDKPPVILIHSGYIDAKHREEALSNGAHGILDKPIGRSEMIVALRKFGLPCKD